jgi:hypothetical protein
MRGRETIPPRQGVAFGCFPAEEYQKNKKNKVRLEKVTP